MRAAATMDTFYFIFMRNSFSNIDKAMRPSKRYVLRIKCVFEEIVCFFFFIKFHQNRTADKLTTQNVGQNITYRSIDTMGNVAFRGNEIKTISNEGVSILKWKSLD